MSKSISYDNGFIGEKIAQSYLENKGFIHIESRYKTKLGEIDLIMSDRGTIVFVEVKYRTKGIIGDGLYAINRLKQDKILKAVNEYIYNNNVDSDIRIDVVEIVGKNIIHIENAINE